MGKRTSSQPPPVDPAALASAQGAANKDTAIAQARLNQVNEITPYGTSTYSPTGEKIDGIQQFERKTTLNPEEQKMLDSERAISQQLLGTGQNLINRVDEATANRFSLDNAPAVTGINEDARNKVEDALYSRATNRLDSRFSDQQGDLETQLATQGFARGSEAWNREMNNFEENKNDAYEQARLGAEAQGISEQGRLFGLEQSQRSRAIEEQLLERGMPLQEIQALLGTAPGVTNPNFSATPQAAIAPTDVVGAQSLASSMQANAAAQQAANRNSLTGGLFGLGSSIGSAALLA